MKYVQDDIATFVSIGRVSYEMGVAEKGGCASLSSAGFSRAGT